MYVIMSQYVSVTFHTKRKIITSLISSHIKNISKFLLFSVSTSTCFYFLGYFIQVKLLYFKKYICWWKAKVKKSFIYHQVRRSISMNCSNLIKDFGFEFWVCNCITIWLEEFFCSYDSVQLRWRLVWVW